MADKNKKQNTNQEILNNKDMQNQNMSVAQGMGEISIPTPEELGIDILGNDLSLPKIENKTTDQLSIPLPEPVSTEKKKVGFFNKIFSKNENKQSAPPIDAQPLQFPAQTQSSNNEIYSFPEQNNNLSIQPIPQLTPMDINELQNNNASPMGIPALLPETKEEVKIEKSSKKSKVKVTEEKSDEIKNVPSKDTTSGDTEDYDFEAIKQKLDEIEAELTKNLEEIKNKMLSVKTIEKEIKSAFGKEESKSSKKAKQVSKKTVKKAASTKVKASNAKKSPSKKKR